MLSKELELTLNHAFRNAFEKRHEFISVEHLLLAMLDNHSAVEVLKSCGANVEWLRQELVNFLEETTPLIAPGVKRETQPTLGFQRVLQRAAFHVQSSGKQEVTGANVLVAIFSEQDSHAVFLLNQQDVSRLDVVNYISHGISKLHDEADPVARSSSGEAEDGESSPANALDKFAENLNELAKSGKIDPLIGRRGEVERTIQVLCRRRKNNPLLVGEAGVGKTAIAEGLAKKIVDGSGRPGRWHQIPRRFREAAQVAAGATQETAPVDSVYRRNPYHHWSGLGVRRRHGRLQPHQAGVGLR